MKRYRLPIFLVVAALLIGAAAWTRFDSTDATVVTRPDPSSASDPTTGSSDRETPSTTTQRETTTTVPAPTTTIVANPQAYANALYGYWQHRDRKSARLVASEDAVAHLFSKFWREKDGWTAKGCTGAAGSTYCTWTRPKWQLVIQVRNATGGKPVLVVAADIGH